MKSSINGSRKYQINEKTGIAEDILSFYPESYLNNNKHPEYYTVLNKEEIICEFIIKEKLGEGAFGSVHLGINKQTGEKVAIKILEKIRLFRYQDKVRLEREIEILKKLKHPNIVQLYGVIETDNQILLIMEYIKGQELYQYILIKKKLSEEEACLYFKQIISGLEYLNKLKIAHRDIKTENILIEQNSKTIKIIDFGLSNTYGDKENKMLRTPCGSPFYAAPEMLKGELYKGGKVDIWSVGVVLFAMICGYLPFEGEEDTELFKKIVDGKYSIPPHVSNQARELIYQLLSNNPKKRINISKIKKHPWIKYYSNGLNTKEDVTFNIGLFIEKNVIPIDEDIIDDLEKKFKLSKVKCRIDILSNNFNDRTTLYYLLVHQKIIRGKKSISDWKSDLFLEYINDKKNLLSNYKKSLNNVINARKNGIILNNENIDINVGNNFYQNNFHLKSQDKIDFKQKEINNLKLTTQNYKSSFNLNNRSKSKSIKKNIENIENNYNINNNKKMINQNPLIKTKSKKKFNNINIKTHRYSQNKTTRYKNKKFKFEINVKNISNKISPKFNSATLSPTKEKNKKYHLSNVNNQINKESEYNSELNLRKKINKTVIINNQIKIKDKKNEKKIYPKIKISNGEIGEEKKEKIIKDYKQEKEKSTTTENEIGETENFHKKGKNKNIYIRVGEKYGNTENNQEKIINDDSNKKNKTIPKLGQFNENSKTTITNNLITDEKTKYAQTLDTFSITSINQEENLISSNNHTFQNFVEASFYPSKDIKKKINQNKNGIDNNGIINTKNKSKLKKTNLFRMSKKSDIENNLRYKNNIINNIYNISKNNKKNYMSLKKRTNKNIDGTNYKRKNLENINMENICFNKEMKKNSMKNLKNKSIQNNNNLNYEKTYHLINHISSFNSIDETNDLYVTENNFRNKNKENNKNIKQNNKYRNKRFNSMESEINKNKKYDNALNLKNILNNNATINKKNRININKLSSPRITNCNLLNIKPKTKRKNDNSNKFYLNKSGANSGFLFNRNEKYNKSKIFSEYSSMSNTLYKKNNENNESIDANKDIKKDFLNNLKNYFSNQNINSYRNSHVTENFQPLDLNCIFIYPRKVMKEKIIKVLQNIKCKIKQINSYKFDINYNNKKNQMKFSLIYNGIGILRIKKIKGINSEFINNARKIIYEINE